MLLWLGNRTSRKEGILICVELCSTPKRILLADHRRQTYSAGLLLPVQDTIEL
jgi:hypothetical protein